MSDPALPDIDDAKSDNASLRLDNMDRTPLVILAGAAFLDTLGLVPGVELELIVNVAGVPAESPEDAIMREKVK